MSTAIVARKDFDDAIRSRMVLAIVAIFGLFASLIVVAPTQIGDLSDVSAAEALAFTVFPARIIVPIVALIVGYMAVVGERESGSIKMLLGFPHSRRDVVAGKLLGRSGVIAVGIVAGFLIAGVLSVVLYGSVPVRNFLAVVGVTLFLGLVFVGFAVGVSAGVRSRGAAMAIVVGMFIVFNVIWGFITSILLYAVEGSFFIESGAPNWYQFLVGLSPTEAYTSAASAVLTVDAGNLASGGEAAADAAAAGQPFYLQDWFGFVVLTVWMVVPLAIGYWRFSRADLG